MTGKPPYSEINEQAALNQMLVNPTSRDLLSTRLEASDFYQPKHQTIFDAILKTIDQQDTPDTANITTAVADRLYRDDDLDKIGGMDYLATLAAAPVASADYLAKQIKGDSIRRRIIQSGEQITQIGHTLDTDSSTLVKAAVEQVLEIEASDMLDEDYQTAYEAASRLTDRMDDLRKHPEHPQGLLSGYEPLDELVGGFLPGQMIVVAGRPGMGKSTLAMDFARHASITNRIPTIIFNLEMGAEELMERLLAAQLHLPMQYFNDPAQMAPDEWDRVQDARNRLEDTPLYIDDGVDITMGSVRAKCRRLNRSLEHEGMPPLGLVVIDYLQLMSSGKKVESRQQEVSAFSRQCKMLAKELNVPVVVLSQLNRNSEQRGDKVPEMADLRESGSIEQDADMVMLVHRPEVYDHDERPGEADVILAKHRNGPIGSVTLGFVADQSRFAPFPPDKMFEHGYGRDDGDVAGF